MVVVFALASVLNLTTGLSQYQHVEVFRTSNVAGEIMTVRHKESGLSFLSTLLGLLREFQITFARCHVEFFWKCAYGKKISTSKPKLTKIVDCGSIMNHSLVNIYV